MKSSNQSGIALVSALLITLLMAAVLIGFTALVASDNRLRGLDASRSNAFYAAHAGLEKLTSDLGNLFAVDFSPSAAQLAAVEAAPPVLPNIAFTAVDGLGYDIAFLAGANGNPTTENRTILSGPYQGFIGLVTHYTLTVTARTTDGSEARLQRSLQTVSIPVFQFGVFSETDLTFAAGDDFNFGGRVHTNGNLWLAEGTNNTLTLSDRVTALGEVIRTNLSNGRPTSAAQGGIHGGTVRVIRQPGTYRNLTMTEGSLVNTLNSARNEPTWTNLSTGTYNHNIMNGRTGARRLDLPLITIGGAPIDIIRRPVPGENALVTGQRLFSQASIRILLSDASAAITNLPGVTATAPVPLERLATTPIAGYTVDADHAPLATSSNDTTYGYRSPAQMPLHGGFMKIEFRNALGVWNDVTVEWLNLGISRRNIDSAGCAEPNPNAILRIQRVRANPASGAPCAVDSVQETDYWPLVLYDIREAWGRDNLADTSTNLYLNGVMHYLDLDVNNLRRWLAGQIPGSGTQVLNDNGYVLYFSDRRGNRDLAGNETGEFGSEDIVNPNDAANGAPNGVPDAGEDVNGNNVLDTYGATPVIPAGFVLAAPIDAAATPRTSLTNGAGNDSAMNKARVNRAIFFRRALKLTNGTLGNLPASGLTVVSENPAYVEGHYNANAAGFGAGSAPASVIADAVTLLSANWSDTRSFQDPADPLNGRPAAAATSYRFGVIAGKGLAFPYIAGTGASTSFGTDGGVHNFLRLIEYWGNRTLNYRGSIASFFYSRQALGLYRCCTNVYQLPTTRNTTFDSNFLNPAQLPPATPMFRDINSLGFTYVIRPR